MHTQIWYLKWNSLIPQKYSYHNLPNIEKLESPISIKEIEFVMKRIPPKKYPELDDFIDNSTKCLKKN